MIRMPLAEAHLNAPPEVASVIDLAPGGRIRERGKPIGSFQQLLEGEAAALNAEARFPG